MNNQELKTRDVPKDSDVMILKEFIEACNSRLFMDYDGHGYYAIDSNTMTNIKAKPSEIRNGNILTNYTHVVWFNK